MVVYGEINYAFMVARNGFEMVLNFFKYCIELKFIFTIVLLNKIFNEGYVGPGRSKEAS